MLGVSRCSEEVAYRGPEEVDAEVAGAASAVLTGELLKDIDAFARAVSESQRTSACHENEWPMVDAVNSIVEAVKNAMGLESVPVFDGE